MDISLLETAIREMCHEVESRPSGATDWRALSEAQLVYEAMVCIAGSQTRYEVAMAMAERLRDLGLCEVRPRFDRDSYFQTVLAALEQPVFVTGASDNGRTARIRFRNRLARLLTDNATRMARSNCTLRTLLDISASASEARARIVQNVSGLGPKQASLFLRRVGYCSDLAVLDVHILDYLRLAKGLVIKAGSLGRLQTYERTEDQFRRIAEEFGYSVGCLDLATWVTMRTAKREALL